MSSLGFNREVKLASRFFALAVGVGLLGPDVLRTAVHAAASADPVVTSGGTGQAAVRAPSISVDLDGDGRVETLSLDDAGTLSVTAGSGAGSRLVLALGDRHPRVSEGKLALEKLRGGEPLVVATALRAKGQRVALWTRLRGGKLETVYSGPLGPVGSDGEYSVGIEVQDGELIRYQTAPAVERCDGEKRLFVERFVPEGAGKWVASTERILTKLASAEPLTASMTGPSELPNQPLGLYRIQATSRQAGIERADLLTAPRELDDGQVGTVWRGPHDARGTFFTWRAESAGRSLRAVRVIPGTATQGIMPATLVLTVSTQQSYRISTAGANKPVWIVLPRAAATDCVSLTIENPATKEGQSSALAEVSLFSDLDGRDALAALVGQLSTADMRGAEAAERTLRSQAATLRPDQVEPLLRALAAAVPSAKGSARRRIQGLLQRLADRSQAMPTESQILLVETLLSALALAEIEERPTVFSALTSAIRGEKAQSAAVGKLESLTVDAKRSKLLRAESAGWLVEHGPWPYPLVLGSKLSRELTLRTTFAKALGKTLHCVGPQDPRWSSIQDELRRPGSDPAWLVLLGEGLVDAQAGCPSEENRRDLAEKLGGLWTQLESLAGDEAGFALRYRLVGALAKLDLSTTAPLVLTILRQEKEPELRQLSARAIGRSQTVDLDGVRRAVADSDPGVRVALLTGFLGRKLLGPQREELSGVLLPLLSQDRWPMVRRAASEVLASTCQPGSAAQSALDKAVSDDDESVAAASLAGLSRCVGAQGLSRYQSLLLDEKSKPSVRGQACVLVARHGLSKPETAANAHRAIGDGLSELLDDPHAVDRSLVAALLCIRALGEHGDGTDIGLLLTRLDRDAPLALRRGAVDSLIRICQRQKSPLEKDDRKGLAELLQKASEPSDALLHGLRTKLQNACGPWSAAR